LSGKKKKGGKKKAGKKRREKKKKKSFEKMRKMTGCQSQRRSPEGVIS